MKDRVIFRKWGKRNGGSVIAMLPDNEVNVDNVDMYEHIGGHGEGARSIVGVTTLATEPEYRDLLTELTSIGYDLRVMKRLS